MVTPLPQSPSIKRVFVSHGWGLPEHEHMVDDFITRLDEKLRYLPHNQARAYQIELWFDRRQVNARSGTFESQTVPACSAAHAIILLLNDKFYDSKPCQAEVDCFRDTNGNFRHDKAVKIQVSGRRSHGTPEMVDGPVQPELFSQAFPNLLALWTKGDDHQRDEFLLAIREDLLAILDK